MTPFLPPQLTLWGSPLYGELCLGLCRALAAPWLPGVGRASVATRSDRSAHPAAARNVARSGWTLLDNDPSDPVPITAGSLAELRRTVRDLRTLGDNLEALSVAGWID